MTRLQSLVPSNKNISSTQSYFKFLRPPKPVSNPLQSPEIEIDSEKHDPAQSEAEERTGNKNQISKEAKAVENGKEIRAFSSNGEEEVARKKYLSGVPFFVLTLALMATTFVAGLDQNIICECLTLKDLTAAEISI
jgi:hypothetical protein